MGLYELEKAIEELPGEATVPVSFIREKLEEGPDPEDWDEEAATVAMWVERCTRNLCREA